MSEMIATANAKSIEEIKSFLSRQKEVYKIPYETHPATVISGLSSFGMTLIQESKTLICRIMEVEAFGDLPKLWMW